MRLDWLGVIALVGCGASLLDDARFDAPPVTVARLVALGAPPVDRTLSAADRIADVAYLEDVLGHLVGPLARSNRMAWRRAALASENAEVAAFCTALVVDYSPVVATPPCDRTAGTSPRPSARLAPAPGPAYTWRLDVAALPSGSSALDDRATAVGVLSIASFVAPDDPRWSGFGDVLRALASTASVVIDLRGARGDDPRMGVAILDVLGVPIYPQFGVAPPVFHDDAIATAARAAFTAKHPEVSARPRELWASVSTEASLHALARALVSQLAPGLVPAARPHPDVRVLFDAETGIAGELVAHLVDVNTVIGAEPATNQWVVDEWAAIRLPRSGIELAVPTVRYGPPFYINDLRHEHRAADATPAGQLPSMHGLAARRALVAANAASPRPSCAALPVDPTALRHKLERCDKSASELDDHTIELALPAAEAMAFLRSCPGLTITAQPGGTDFSRGSAIEVRAPPDTLERLAAATFVDAIGCLEPPYHLN